MARLVWVVILLVVCLVSSRFSPSGGKPSETSTEWQRLAWLEKAARILRHGHGLGPDEDTVGLLNLSKAEIVEKLMAEPQFNDTIFDFNTFFLGFKMNDLHPDGGYAPLAFEFPNAITSARELLTFIRSRYAQGSSGMGRFNRGARGLLHAYDHTSDLQRKLLKLRAHPNAHSDEALYLELLGDYFRAGVAKSAIWVFPEPFDVHDAGAAKRQPKIFRSATDRLALIFKSLKAMPFDKRRNMLDVTTVMVASEFSRTMRDLLAPLGDTGTNHNQLNNSIRLGGKGIRGGLVLGASDFSSADAKLSGAHLLLDAERVQAMGRPFDFTKARPRTDLPAQYDVKDYLVVDSIINTIYTLFGVSKTHFRKLGRNEPEAPILRQILS